MQKLEVVIIGILLCVTLNGIYEVEVGFNCWGLATLLGMGGLRLPDAYRMTALMGWVLFWRYLCKRTYTIFLGPGWKYNHPITRKVLLVCDYHLVLYTALLYEVYSDIRNVWQHEYIQYDYMNPKYISDMQARLNMTAEVIKEISEEASLESYPYLMRWFPLAAPWFALITLLICFYISIRHVAAMWDWNRYPDWQASYKRHDSVIQITALPVVYGIMSLKSLMRAWQVVLYVYPAQFVEEGADPFTVYKTHRDLLLSLGDANYSFADVFEAWSLSAFAGLVYTVIQDKHESAMRQLNETAHHSNETSEKASSMAVKKVEEKGSKMMEAMKSLAFLGIQSFLVSCFLASAYALLFFQVRRNFPDRVEEYASKHFQNKVHWFLLGVGAVTSTVAISNILTLESTFHEELHHFFPSGKFWSTKILVSIAFLQEIVVNCMGFSEIQTSIVYSSFLCLECMLVSLLHHHSWGANESWYSAVAVEGVTARYSTEAVKGVSAREKETDRKSVV